VTVGREDEAESVGLFKKIVVAAACAGGGTVTMAEKVPPAARLARIPDASAGLRVRVTGGRVTMLPWPADAVVVTVTVAVTVLVGETGRGTVVFPDEHEAIPPVAPVALMRESALASLVQERNVPLALTEGRAKHLRDEGHSVDCHADDMQFARAPAMHADWPVVHGSDNFRT